MGKSKKPTRERVQGGASDEIIRPRDLHGVGCFFVADPRNCVNDKSARGVIREYDLDWKLLVSGLRRLFKDDPTELHLAERFADFLAGYKLVRDMESQLKGIQKGGLKTPRKPLGHGPVSLGRGLRKRVPVYDPSGKKLGTVSLRDVLGDPDFTPAVTARVKTRLLAEMSEDLRAYPTWKIEEFLPKMWELVGVRFRSDSPSRILRRARKRRARH